MSDHTFSIKQFGSFFRFYFIQYRPLFVRHLWVTYAVFSLFFLFVGVLIYNNALVFSEKTTLDDITGATAHISFILLYPWAAIAASHILHDVHNPEEHLITHRHPASSLEKYLVYWVVHVILFLFAYMVVTLAADLTRAALTKIFYPRIADIYPCPPADLIRHLPGKTYLHFFLFFLWIQSYFALGSSIWKRFAFWKSLCIILVLTGVALLVFDFLIKYVLQTQGLSPYVYIPSDIIYYTIPPIIFNWCMGYLISLSRERTVAIAGGFTAITYAVVLLGFSYFVYQMPKRIQVSPDTQETRTLAPYKYIHIDYTKDPVRQKHFRTLIAPIVFEADSSHYSITATQELLADIDTHIHGDTLYVFLNLNKPSSWNEEFGPRRVKKHGALVHFNVPHDLLKIEHDTTCRPKGRIHYTLRGFDSRRLYVDLVRSHIQVEKSTFDHLHIADALSIALKNIRAQEMHLSDTLSNVRIHKVTNKHCVIDTISVHTAQRYQLGRFEGTSLIRWTAHSDTATLGVGWMPHHQLEIQRDTIHGIHND